MAKEKNKTEQPQALEGDLKNRLLQLRETIGYSTSQMAEALCLSEDVINNLENEAFDLLPDPPYVRGYLRNYAKLGEIDPSELIDTYDSLRGVDNNELQYNVKSNNINVHSKKRMSPIVSQLLLLALLVAGIGALSTIPEVNQWFKNRWADFYEQLKIQTTETATNPNNPLLTGTMPVPVPLPEINETGIESPPSSESMTEEAKTQNEETQNKIDNSEQNTQTSGTSTESTTDSSSTTPSITPETTDTPEATTENTSAPNDDTTLENSSLTPISIKLVFNQEVWLRIKNKENKTVYEGLNQSGTSKDLSFEKPLTFKVGNAQGLSLFVDEKAVDISTYIKGSVANFSLE